MYCFISITQKFHLAEDSPFLGLISLLLLKRETPTFEFSTSQTIPKLFFPPLPTIKKKKKNNLQIVFLRTKYQTPLEKFVYFMFSLPIRGDGGGNCYENKNTQPHLYGEFLFQSSLVTVGHSIQFKF